MPALTLDRSVEEAVEKSLQQTEQGTFLAMEPKIAEGILAALKSELNRLPPGQGTPVVLASPLVRFYFKRLIERAFPQLAVISYNELDPDLTVDVLGRVSLT